MKELIIKVQPFTMKQTIYIKDGRHVKEEKVDYRELAKFISNCSDLDTVHFFGSQKIAQKIALECATKYNMNRNKVKFVFNK